MLGLRSETDALVRVARRDLSAMWREVRSGASAKVVLNDVLPAIVTEYGLMGAAMAADWYDEQRDEAGARRRFTAEPLDADDRGVSGLIGFALTTATDDDSLEELILGGTQRRIADHVRLTVTSNSVRDPGARGWIRVGKDECDWCEQYIDGETRMVEGYDFPAHDNCRCSVEPDFT